MNYMDLAMQLAGPQFSPKPRGIRKKPETPEIPEGFDWLSLLYGGGFPGMNLPGVAPQLPQMPNLPGQNPFNIYQALSGLRF